MFLSCEFVEKIDTRFFFQIGNNRYNKRLMISTLKDWDSYYFMVFCWVYFVAINFLSEMNPSHVSFVISFSAWNNCRIIERVLICPQLNNDEMVWTMDLYSRMK